MAVAGDIDRLAAPMLAGHLAPLIAGGGHVCVNFVTSPFSGSPGRESSTTRRRNWGDRGRLVVLDPSVAVRRAFELIGLHDAIDLRPPARC